MHEAPLVSIIIPCYNAADYISEAIESALAQTYRNCEVIVVDDGSRDNSLEVVKSFGDKVILVTGPNGGASIARNRGLAVAKGDWIQFLDSDDVILPSCVQSKVEEPKEPGEIVCSSITLMGDAPEEEMTYFWRFPVFDEVNMVLHGTPQTACPLHRRTDLNRIGGFDPELKIAEEYDLHLRLAFDLKLRFRIIKTPGVVIRPRPNSLSREASGRATGRNDTVRALLKLYRQHGSHFSSGVREAFGKRAADTARALLKAGDRQNADEWIRICESVSPSGMRAAYKSDLVAAVAKCMGYDRFERMHSLLHRLG